MSEQFPPPDGRGPVQVPGGGQAGNVSRPRPAQPNGAARPGSIGAGLALALIAIPVGMAFVAVAVSLAGMYGTLVATFGPYVAIWLFRLGARGFPRRALGGFLAVNVPVVLGGAIAAAVSLSFTAYLSVGGDGGLFSPTFWSTFMRQVTSGGDTFLALIAGFGLGIVGVVIVLRQALTANPAADVAAPAYGSATPSSTPASEPMPTAAPNGTSFPISSPQPPESPGTPVGTLPTSPPSTAAPGHPSPGEPFDQDRH